MKPANGRARIMFESAYFAVALVGLLHGLEPGHGWPVAMLYAGRSSRPLFKGLVSSWVISMFHLISSVAVVVVYVVLSSIVGFSLSYVRLIAGGALAFLGAKLLLKKPRDDFAGQHGHLHGDFAEGKHEHEHGHPGGIRHSHIHSHARRILLSLWSIAVLAFALGFAHEEEFALLALAVGGINPLALMVTYALAVTIGLIGITLVAVKMYGRVEAKLRKHEGLLPKFSGLLLLVMAATFFMELR